MIMGSICFCRVALLTSGVDTVMIFRVGSFDLGCLAMGFDLGCLF